MEERQKEKIPHRGRAQLVFNTARSSAEKAPEFREKPGFESIPHSAGRSRFIIYLDSSVPLTQAAFPVAFHIPGPSQTETGCVVQRLCKRCQRELPRLCSCSGGTMGSLGLAAEENAAVPRSSPWRKCCLSPWVTDLFLQWLSEVWDVLVSSRSFYLLSLLPFSGFALSLLLLNCMGKSKGSRCQICLKSIARRCLPGDYSAWQGFLITGFISVPLL